LCSLFVACVAWYFNSFAAALMSSLRFGTLTAPSGKRLAAARSSGFYIHHSPTAQ
jgi:hypothetical protein